MTSSPMVVRIGGEVKGHPGTLAPDKPRGGAFEVRARSAAHDWTDLRTEDSSGLQSRKTRAEHKGMQRASRGGGAAPTGRSATACSPQMNRSQS